MSMGPPQEVGKSSGELASSPDKACSALMQGTFPVVATVRL